jgi:isopentenyl-diphosphate delta-isomerase
MHEKRKADHIRIALEEKVQFAGVTPGFERYFFVPRALPELDLAQVDLSTKLLGKNLRAPLIVSSMTGGVAEAQAINRRLAEAAQERGVGMGVGSQRPALEDPSLVGTYRVRDVAKDILLLANLGAVQLNYGYGLDQCRRAVEMIQADALILHLNALQECLQPGGNTSFAGLLAKIEEICRHLEVPVVVKEVGWGISEDVARQLTQAGVAAIDVAGAGGTSWSEVERHRIPKESGQRVAAAFAQWGLSTVDSLRMCRRATEELPLIASGGVRDGIDVAKSIALGATAAGMASPFLRPATVSAQAVVQAMEEIIQELRIAMFLVGARDLAALKDTPALQERT